MSFAPGRAEDYDALREETHESVYALYRQLRAHCPVPWSHAWNGFWSLMSMRTSRAPRRTIEPSSTRCRTSCRKSPSRGGGHRCIWIPPPIRRFVPCSIRCCPSRASQSWSRPYDGCVGSCWHRWCRLANATSARTSPAACRCTCLPSGCAFRTRWPPRCGRPAARSMWPCSRISTASSGRRVWSCTAWRASSSPCAGRTAAGSAGGSHLGLAGRASRGSGAAG